MCSSLRCDVNDSRSGITCRRGSSCQMNCKIRPHATPDSILIVEYLARNNTRYRARRRVLVRSISQRQHASLNGSLVRRTRGDATHHINLANGPCRFLKCRFACKGQHRILCFVLNVHCVLHAHHPDYFLPGRIETFRDSCKQHL